MKEDQHKIHFCQTKVPFTNRLHRHFGPSTSQVYNIHAKIIEELIFKYYVADEITTMLPSGNLNSSKKIHIH